MDIDEIIEYVKDWRDLNKIGEPDKPLSEGQLVDFARDLREQIKQVSVEPQSSISGKQWAADARPIPYSGDVGDMPAWKLAKAFSENGDGKIFYISDTPGGELLNSSEFANALQVTTGGADEDLGLARMKQLMAGMETAQGRSAYGVADIEAINDQISRRMMFETAHGDMRTITPAAAVDKVFVQTELPALLQNQDVTAINGIPKEELRQILQSTGSIEAVNDVVARASAELLDGIQYTSTANQAFVASIDGTGLFRNSGIEGPILQAGIGPVRTIDLKLHSLADDVQLPDPAGETLIQQGNRAMSQRAASGLSVDACKQMVLEFCEIYPVAAQVSYKIRTYQEELYGPEATKENVGTILGAFSPGERQADFAASNFRNEDEFKATLKHEVLGHAGINTFTVDEKAAVLDAIIDARDQPVLRGLWRKIDQLYDAENERIKAEEVYAFMTERVRHDRPVDPVAAEKSFTEVCVERNRPMTERDLMNITSLVAQGMQEQTRTIQEHPLENYDMQRKANAEAQPKPFEEAVAEKLMVHLKQGNAPWQIPQEAGRAGSTLPYNPVTGERYKGINALHLMSEGRDDQRWMTYKQAAAEGAQVRSGEQGTSIQFWKFNEEQPKFDQAGKPVRNAEGELVKETVKLERPKLFHATVFNAEQIDGLPPQQAHVEQSADGVQRAEQILAASGATIRHDDSDRAVYRPSTDTIHLPEKNQFASADRYYATALQELSHWTGHSSRLDRELVHPFGSDGYAKEMLRVEISSMILGDELGIGHDPGQHAAYAGSWIKTLEDDPLEIFRAAADAERMQAYLLALERQQVQEHPLNNFDQQGQTVAESLVAGNARSISDEHEQSAMLAAIHEERVRRNPNSTAEDLTAARDARKDAEFAAANDIDLQRRNELEQRQSVPQAGTEALRQESQKHLLDVPFLEKDDAKALGAKFDRQEQSWFIPANIDPAPFAKWAQAPAVTSASNTRNADPVPAIGADQVAKDRTYLAVPYSERHEAKAAGAKWDSHAKSWFASSDADMPRLEKWKPENVPVQQDPAMPPREEFADALRSIGCVIPPGSEHPIMDGARHRISVEGEKVTQHGGSGSYVGNIEGQQPTGHMRNNKTGAELQWQAKGYTVDPEHKARLAAQAVATVQQREAALAMQHQQAASQVVLEADRLTPAVEPTAYMRAKGIDVHAGALTDQEGQKTFLPAVDVTGKQWTTQYIQEDGAKHFAKGSKQEGCFHIVGGSLADLASAPAIVIAEGYATAATVKQSLDFPTICAFDEGNLAAVAVALHQKFPDKPFVIAGDDDRHLEITQGINPGRTKAEEAAKLVGGKAMLPIFAPGENRYPANLAPVTPSQYSKHLNTGNELAEEQLTALASMKQFTDFNDLATRSTLGAEAVDRQVRSMVGSVIEKHHRTLGQQQGQAHGLTGRREGIEKPVQEAARSRKAARIA